MWRDNPVLVECFNNYRDELQHISEGKPYIFVAVHGNGFLGRRRKLGLSQVQLGEIAGLHSQTIGRIEKGLGGTKVVKIIDDALTRLEEADFVSK